MKYSLSESIDILERTPKILDSLLRGLPEEWIKSNEGSNTWSPFDIIGHYIHGEQTDWIPRAQIILSDAIEKTFEPFDRFAQFEVSKGKNMVELLDTFREERAKNIETLKAMKLTEDDLDKKGVHPELGPVSLRHLLAAWTVHDLSHINQITRVMAKQYTKEVGPWPQYMTILNS